MERSQSGTELGFQRQQLALSDIVMNLEVEKLLSEIRSQGWVQTTAWFDVIDSTNAQARSMLGGDRGISTPVLLVAEQQTAGRGRASNEWWSPSGCLMMTLAVHRSELTSKLADMSQLAFVCGVALADAAKEYTHDSAIQLKWPNDLYLEGRKCAGILIESGPENHWLIGIGFNVNVDFAQAPEEIRHRATSLHLHSTKTSSEPQPEWVLFDLICALQKRITRWAEGSDAWMSEWRSYCLLTGKSVALKQIDGQQLEGFCEGIDSAGNLLLRVQQRLLTINSAEIVAWH